MEKQTLDYVDRLNAQVNEIIGGAVALIPNLVLALSLVLLTWILARSAVGIANWLTRKTTLREDLKRLTVTLVRLGIWVTGLLLAATILIPGLTPASLVGGLGIGALAIGFAFQDIFENFLAGVLIMLRDRMEIGDIVESEGILGKVEKITLRETHIREFSGELVMVPNSMIFKSPVKVVTDETLRRNELVVGVAYDSDLVASEKAIRAALEAIPLIDKGKGVEVYASNFGASSIDFLVRWWTDTRANDYLGVKHEAIIAINDGLKAAGIEIPFPHVTHTFRDRVPLTSAA